MASTKVPTNPVTCRDIEGSSWAMVNHIDCSNPIPQDTNEQLDLHALSSAWDSSYGASPLTCCYLASKVKNYNSYSKEQLNVEFNKLIFCEYIEELDQPIRFLNQVFNGLLKINLIKIAEFEEDIYQVLISFNAEQQGDMYCLFRGKKTIGEKPSKVFKKLLESGVINDELNTVGLNLPDIIPEQKTRTVGFVVNYFLYGSTSTMKTSTQLTSSHRKLEHLELKLFVTLVLSDLVKDTSEYFELFPTNPFNAPTNKQTLTSQEQILSNAKEKSPDDIQQELREQKDKAVELFFQHRTIKRRENEKLLFKLVGQIQLFKAAQHYQACIVNRHFPLIYKTPHFDGVDGIFTTDISKGQNKYSQVTWGKGIGNQVIYYLPTEEVATDTVTSISKNENLIPSSGLPLRIKNHPDVKPAGVGLYNWKSTCFMNSAFTFMATNLSATTTEKELNDCSSIPVLAMAIMVDKGFECYPMDKEIIVISIGGTTINIDIKGLSRIQIMNAIAGELVKQPLETLITHKIMVGQTPDSTDIDLKLPLWLSFKESCNALFTKLNSDTDFDQIPIELQVTFLNSYFELSKYLFRSTSSLRLLLPRHDFANKLFNLPEQLMFGGIDQHDPQEFIQDIYDLLGIYNQPERILQTDESFALLQIKTNKVISTHKAKTEGSSQFIPVDNKTQSPKIDNILQQFSSIEELKYSETRVVEAFKKQAAIENDISPDLVLEKQIDTALDESLKPKFEKALENTFKSYRIQKQLKFVAESSLIPESLMIQIKLFKFNSITKETTKPEATYKVCGKKIKGDLGRLSLAELIKSNFIIEIPIYLDEDKKATLIKYKVDAVICHSGDSVLCGHYRTLKFKNDKVILYDDDTVVTFTDYQKIHGHSPNRSLLDFVDNERLSGYLYTLRRVEGD